MSVEVLRNNDEDLSLRGMVDIALGTPEVGSVNFNMLHTLLHALISKFDLDSVVIALSPEDTQLRKEKGPVNVISLSTTPFHLLQDRIKLIEKQFINLNSLPSNKDILNGIFGEDKTEVDSQNKRLVSELWQTLNMRKKINTNEEGIDRLSSLIDSILREMKELRSENDNMRKKLEGLENLSGINDKINELQSDFAKLLAEFNKLKKKFADYPSDDFFQNIVTWEGLEKALRGVRDEMDEFTKPKEKVFVNMSTEEDKPMVKDNTVATVIEDNVDEKVERRVEENIIQEHEAYLEWNKDGCHLKLPLPVKIVLAPCFVQLFVLILMFFVIRCMKIIKFR